MPKFVVYEVWTCHRVIEAESEEAAYQLSDPNGSVPPSVELNLANWHVVPVEPQKPAIKKRGQ